MSENIDTGMILEALNDKTDRDCRNVDTTSGADAVIEYQIPTAENNYTWYRKYASGWVEQGGYRSSISGNVTITLPVTMEDTNYTLVKTINDDYSGNSNGCNWASASAVKVSVSQIRLNYLSGGTIQSWEVKGMSAQS